jgi:hypothetical protein
MSTNTNLINLKRSERNNEIQSKSRQQLFKIIKEQIECAKNEQYTKTKILVAFSIYKLLLDNFNLLFVEYKSGYYFFGIIFNKALEINESIINEIHNGKKFKIYLKNMYIIINKLQKKYLDNIFLKLLKKTIYKKDNINNDINKCPICLDNLTNNVFETPCNHTFHKKCLYTHLLSSLSCPMCRNCMHF